MMIMVMVIMLYELDFIVTRSAGREHNEKTICRSGSSTQNGFCVEGVVIFLSAKGSSRISWPGDSYHRNRHCMNQAYIY